MPRILVAVPHQPNNDRMLSPVLRRGLEELGEVAWFHDNQGFAEAVRRAHPEIVVGSWGTPCLTRALRREVPGLRVYAHLAGGVRPYVERACIEDGLVVSNWGDLAGPFVAEASLAMLLAAMRRLSWFDAGMHGGKRWKDPGFDPPVRSLIGRRVGIHGFGAIGRALAPMLAGLRCRTVAFDPFVPAARMQELGVEAAESAQDLYRSCTAVINLLPDIAATRGLVDRTLLRCLPDGAVYVLTGRAATTDVEALTDEVATGRLLAALDVFPVEPLPLESPLRSLPGAILQPHIGMSDDALDAMVEHLLNRLRAWASTGVMPDAISPARYDLMT